MCEATIKEDKSQPNDKLQTRNSQQYFHQENSKPFSPRESYKHEMYMN